MKVMNLLLCSSWACLICHDSCSKELEQRQDKNDSTESRCLFILKLPRFFPRSIAEWKSAVISKQIFIWTPSSRSYIILALVLSKKLPALQRLPLLALSVQRLLINNLVARCPGEQICSLFAGMDNIQYSKSLMLYKKSSIHNFVGRCSFQHTGTECASW